EEVLGRDCHGVICGYDLFGNRYCQRECPVALMAAEGEALRSFKLVIRNAVGLRKTVSMECVQHPGPAESRLTLFHTVKLLADGVPHVAEHERLDQDTTWSSRPLRQ
ncbi:MAG: hypothetical protein HKN20_17970, partial [Gemmatimonadetes bacterium]|nr:hypothetical protein [Gemmatimonadota bacterium]